MSLQIRLALFLLSVATLAFEINLTRLFSVAQFYHFAFLVVSVALLGFGASGTVLTISSSLGRAEPRYAIQRLSLATSAGMFGSYLFTNHLPFDSFSITIDPRQSAILILHYLALATPFFFSGLAVGLLLSAFPQTARQTYAVNLLGSASGCALALIAPSLVGGEGMVTLSAALSALAAIVTARRGEIFSYHPKISNITILSISLVLLGFACFDLVMRLSEQRGIAFLQLRLSPYKTLSYALQYPGSQVIYQRWNAYSRVDVVQSKGIHSLPGLSYRYLQPLPKEDGLLVDGEDLNGIVHPDSNAAFADYLPSAIAYHLRPRAAVLILEPRGGLDILTALTLGAESVTAVEINSLIIDAVPHIYRDARVSVVVESDRSYLRRAREHYDIVVVSLTSSYHPVRSGAYSLGEDYRYTIEAFEGMLLRLAPNGLLVVTRWLQNPPSEELRAFALAVTALENIGADPYTQIIAFRGYNTGTLLIKNGRFTEEESRLIRDFTAQRAFDLTFDFRLHPEETNIYNVLPESVYYDTFLSLLETQPRQAFYDDYPFDVRPPTDAHPFFGHYFKWAQVRQIWAELGKTWQPFGGAGYFVILALLLLATFASITLILLPLVFLRGRSAGRVEVPRSISNHLFYFIFIGLAFLLVEIPLIQIFILYLGHPSYAITGVLFAILAFSSVGSWLSSRVHPQYALAALSLLLFSAPFWLRDTLVATLGFPLTWRLGLATLILAPVGFLMGIPFPAGIRRLTVNDHQVDQPSLDRHVSSSIPWAWAANGTASVVSSVLAAQLALTFGFDAVLRLGALCYAAALVMVTGRALRWPRLVQ